MRGTTLLLIYPSAKPRETASSGQIEASRSVKSWILASIYMKTYIATRKETYCILPLFLSCSIYPMMILLFYPTTTKHCFVSFSLSLMCILPPSSLAAHHPARTPARRRWLQYIFDTILIDRSIARYGDEKVHELPRRADDILSRAMAGVTNLQGRGGTAWFVGMARYVY